MEEKNKIIPFPQANDFDKIIKIIDIEKEEDLKNKDYMLEYLDLGTERQISYYISACEFLGVIYKHKFTEFGIEIRNACLETRVLKLSQKIISLPVFGEIFLMKYLYNVDVNNSTISQMINDVYDISNIEVCNRRASTVKKRLAWIESNK